MVEGCVNRHSNAVPSISATVGPLPFFARDYNGLAAIASLGARSGGNLEPGSHVSRRVWPRCRFPKGIPYGVSPRCVACPARVPWGEGGGGRERVALL